MIRPFARLLPCLFVVVVVAACDSGPDDATGTTVPGGGGSSGASSGSGGTGGTGGAGGSGGGAGTEGTAGTSSGPATSPTLGYVCKDDTTCTDGLVCLTTSRVAGDGCKDDGASCSKPCTTDAECGLEGEALCVNTKDCATPDQKRCVKDGFSGKIGESCTEKKKCQEGLSCLPFLISKSGGACEPVSNACSKTCTDDASCADLGPKVKCFSCGEARFCGLTG